MEKIALPKSIDFQKGENDDQALVIIGPCYPGYGITIGNALRRVLLSSLAGAAVMGVKIEGVEHEFMALKHMKEDVLEFILNLKKLRLKVHADEKIKLELEVHGKKKVTAADIKENSLVEIVNKDLELATITDMAGQLKAEILVSRGMGYETIESREAENNPEKKREKEIGFIEMDSVFSPVQAVGIKVENVRVGKMTNWDKLILDVKTDGTITPEEAVAAANNILIKQFTALTDQKNSTKPEVIEEEKEVEEVESESEADSEEPKKKRGRPKKEDKA